MKLHYIKRFWLFIALTIVQTYGQITIPQMTHKLILADEGNGKVHFIDLNNPSDKWSLTSSNRDLQLIGNGKLMVSDNNGKGYSEVSIATGTRIKHVDITGVSGGINSAFRLSANDIYCASDGSPAKVFKVDSTGKTVKTITISLDASVRICRPTTSGTFLVGGKVAGMMCEFDSTGKKIWECNAGGEPYMALRLPNGTTLISNGYGGQMVLADKKGTILKKFPSEEDKKKDSLFWKAAKPNFFAGFQILRNGNIVVSNWQGHGTSYGNSGFQLIEIDSALTRVVSYWKQNATMVSSLHGVIVLDSLDTGVLHSDYNGVMQPLTDRVAITSFFRPELLQTKSFNTESAGSFDLQGRLRMVQSGRGCFIIRNGSNVKSYKRNISTQ
jgi:hypothetical protein